MGKKLKGKNRQDKYYHLAKETGYRARSAFKLLQLNKKYNFLQSSQVLVDLCAAPGGWLQVASEHMPTSSVIIGVDLVPIRPIPRCITFQDDITKDSCRSQLKQELHQWKVDCFLHDGAPNVGKNWLHDAYSQSVLTLHALKMSTDFLRKGGWFITKVFRSRDYQALMWVFGQLFNKVHATKPQASRNESAEIFVVCQGYKCPDKIDKKFFDVKSVFEEVKQDEKQIRLKDFDKIGKKKAQGYGDTKGLLYVKKSVSEFLQCETPLKMLSEINELEFDDPRLRNDSLVNEDIIHNVKDIKSLGKKDIKVLLKWHREAKKQQESQQDDTDKPHEDEDEDSDEEIERKLQEIKEMESKLLKKKKKTVLKERKKLRERMSHSGQSMHGQDDMELFTLDKIKSASQLQKIAEVEGVPSDESDLEEHGDGSDDCPSVDGVTDDEDDQNGDLNFDADDNLVDMKNVVDEANPLIESLGESTDTKLWFDQDIFKKIDEDDDEFEEVKQAEEYYKSHDKQSKKNQVLKDQPSRNSIDGATAEGDEGANDSDIESDSDYDAESMFPSKKSEKAGKSKTAKRKLDAEDLALGTVIATSNKCKRDIVDDSFNRYTFNDDEDALPDWFVEDERKRNTRRYLDKHIPDDLVKFYKSKEMKINVRTIKKVAEAKARKKKRLLKKMEKARKQSEGITESTTMSNAEKAAHIKGIYKKAGLLKKQREHKTYVFAKRGSGKRVMRPPGVSGKIKLVDKRLKKDKRSTNTKGNKQSKQSQRRKGRR